MTGRTRLFCAMGLLLLAGAMGGTAGAAVASGPAVIPGFSYIKSLGGIEEYRLDSNGLTVLVRPDHSVPVVTFQVTYRVGSRNEGPGTTGATHILEHLMFKGSEHFNKAAGNDIDRYVASAGARFNATTWYDRTNYFATLGPDALEGYIAIEADRMRNLWLHEADRQSEMTVVRNEYERGENDPASALSTEVFAAAFVAHPYHHPTIGWRSDIENVPISRLRAFYDTFYWPDNATVSVVGDVEPGRALALIRKYYGVIPRAPNPIPAVYTTEPPQQGPRHVIVRRGGRVGSIEIAYKAPDGLQADTSALTLLSAILSRGDNSRLHKALVDTSLAAQVSAGIQPQHDPGLFVLDATLVPGVAHEQAERALLAEVERVKQSGVTTEELQRALSQFRADEAFGRDGPARIAADLNEWIAAGDWTYYVKEVPLMAAVTPADVQRVAKTYLVTDHSTTGFYIPVDDK